MAISYVSAGQSITHGQLTQLTAEFDAILTMAFGGLSWLAFDLGAKLPRAFTVYLGPVGTRFFFPSEPEYDHAPFDAWAAAAVVTDYNDDLELAQVDDLSVAWFLDGSLEAHTVDHVPTGGTEAKPYWLAKWFDPLDADSFRLRERYRRFDTLDVVFDGGTYAGNAFTWPAHWDKYHCIRFHNLRDNPLTIHLPGGHDVSLQAFGIRAVRREYPKGNAWHDDYRYLWQPIPGDQLIWEPLPPESWAPDIRLFSNLTTLSFFQRCVDLLATQPILFRDPAKAWAPSSVTPYPPIADARRVIDYQVAPGTVYSIRNASTVPIFDTLTWSTWAQLEAGIGDDGTGDPIITAVPITGGWDLTGIGAAHDVLGITSELFPALHPVTLPEQILRGTSIPFGATAATAETQTITVEWRPDPMDPPGVPSSYVEVEVDATVFGQGLHSGSVGGDLTFGASKTLSTAGLVSTPDDLTFSWNNWELAIRTEVEFLAAHAESIATDALSSRRQKANPWEGGMAGQYATQFRLPFTGELLSMSPEVEIAPVRIPRRLCLAAAYKDGFGVWHYTGHPDIDGDNGLPGGVEWDFNRKAFENSPIARRGHTAGATMTRSVPVRVLSDVADRVLRYSPTEYQANRAALLAGTLTDEERGQLIRIPVTVEQFNIAAGLINSIVWIVPQTIDLSTWWDLGDGGGPIETHYVPLDFGRSADPAGRATILGMTVLSATDGATTVHYVRHDDLRAAALAKGWPYVAGTMEIRVERAEFGGNWLRGSGTWCAQSLQAVLALKHIKESLSGSDVWESDVYPAVPGYPIPNNQWVSPAIRLVDVAQLAAAPTGWTIKRDTRVVTRPVPSIIYNSVDPIPTSVVIDTVERVVQPAEADETRAWLVSYIYAAGHPSLSPDNLSGLYEADWDDRAATMVTMTPRTGYARL